jgi:ribosome-associated protein
MATPKSTVKKKAPAKKAAPKTAKIIPIDPSRDLAHIIAQAAHDTKATDLTVLDLTKLSAFADYFVIASGSSDRQVQAISDRIQATLKKAGVHPLGVEGYQQGHWILIDCGGVIAHVFFEEARVFYGLDKLWGDAVPVRFALK